MIGEDRWILWTVEWREGQNRMSWTVDNGMVWTLN